MYEDGNKKISFDWKSLAIKLGILAATVLVVILIFNLITGKKDNKTNDTKIADSNSEYITKINLMKDAAFEYFTSDKLPENVGNTRKVTLAEMINQKLLIDFTDNGKTCDLNSSYVQATKTADENYALKVGLKCEKKADFIVTTIEKKDVVNNTNNNNNSTTKPNTNVSKPSNNGSSSSTQKPSTTTTKVTIQLQGGCVFNCSSSDNNNNNTSKPSTPSTGKTRYYKLVKYSPWAKGKSYADNAENKYQTITTSDFCPIERKTYYSSGYVTQGTTKGSYNYELQLKDIYPEDVAHIRLSSKSYFSNSGTKDYKEYINQKYSSLYMTGNSYKYEAYVSNPTTMKNSSLRSSNFTFDVSKIYYSKPYDTYATTVTINFRDYRGITPFYANSFNQYVYFVPLKFEVEVAYKDECIHDVDENWTRYDNSFVLNTREERIWTHRTVDYTWSTNKNLSGWEYTGVYEDR